MTALILTGCNLGQPPPDSGMCTLIGCGASLEITLVGEHIPTEFSMEIASPAETLVNIRCTNGTSQFDPPEAARWSPSCPAGGVTLQDFTPEDLTVTVEWADGQVTQQFQPAYTESRPNGPACEPTCRAARLELRIPFVPPYGDESTWLTYTDVDHGFSFRYPAVLSLDFGGKADAQRVLFVGEKIQVVAGPRDPLVCHGECPLIESTEPVTLSGRNAQLARGYIGSVGGNIPQRFMLYVVRSGTTYISLTLYAADRHAVLADPAIILPLHESDIELFDRIVRTLVLTP
ncbi:MAG TPA: hypothetical protein VFH29_03955 [Anaerolineales bacterium]|nr:hypothetical protein [Anaerolineales bacterium]